MAFLNHWLLIILLILPAAGAAAVWFVRPVLAMRWTALGIALATVCLSLLILIPFKWQRSGGYAYGRSGTVQMARASDQGQSFSVRPRIAIDGLSFPFVMLTTLICAAACAASLNVSRLPRFYFCLILLFESATLGTLLAFDARLFFGFLVASLVPASFLLGTWGGKRRGRAAGKFLAYMVVSSLCLGIVLWNHHLAGVTSDLVALANRGTMGAGRAFFALALIAFLIRLPAIPFHGWFPAMLAEASGPVGAMLGALVPLTGGYGIMRIVLPLFPHAAMAAGLSLAGLAVATILYGALRAWSEKNLSRSIAYGSVSVTGFALMGIAVMSPAGMNGSVFILVSQGLVLGLMMILIGRQTEGSARPGSIYATFFGIAWFAEMVTPGLVGVLTVLLGIFEAARPDSMLRHAGLASPALLYGLAIGASVGIALLAVHAANSLRQIFSSSATGESKATDLPGSDIGFLAPLAAIIILLGILPTALCFGFSQMAVEALLQVISRY